MKAKSTDLRSSTLLAAVAALAFALAIVLLAPGRAWADQQAMSGTCGADGGSNLTWSLTENGEKCYASLETDVTGVSVWRVSKEPSEGAIEMPAYSLSIEGSGAMADYTRSGDTAAPWDRAVLSRVLDSGKLVAAGDEKLDTRGCDEIANPCITHVSIAEGITYIGAHAFRSTGIGDITIPNSVSSIGSYALIRCKDLGAISIAEGGNADKPFYAQDGVLYEKYQTEGGRQGVELRFYPAAKTTGSFTIPSNVTVIGSNSMQDSQCADVVFPEGLASINSFAFSGSKIKQATLPDGVSFGAVRELGADPGAGVFNGCVNLASVKNLPAEGIPTSAFSGCVSLGSIDIPEGVKTLGARCFAYAGVNKLVVPSSVESIGNAAFSHVSPVDGSDFAVSFEKGTALNAVGTDLFAGLDDYQAIFNEDDVDALLLFSSKGYKAQIDGIDLPESDEYVFGWAGKGEVSIVGLKEPRKSSYVIPDEVDGCKVVAIAPLAFGSASNADKEQTVQKVVIGKNVRTIGDGAFKYCVALSQVDFSRAVNLETIGDMAFYDVNGNASSYVGELDLSACSSLKSVGESAFRYCRFAGMKLPSDIESWGKGAIGSRGFSVNIAIPSKTLTTLQSALAKGDDQFTIVSSTGTQENLAYRIKVDASGKITCAVTGFASDDCDKSEIIIPDEIDGFPVTEVVDQAFNNKVNEVSKIEIGANVARIGAQAFGNKQSTNSVLESIVFKPGCAVEVGERAFQKYYQTSKTVTVDAGTREIVFGNNVFLSTPVETAYLAGATKVGQSTFYGNTKLRTLVVNGQASYSDNAFTNATSGAQTVVSFTSAKVYVTGKNTMSDNMLESLASAGNTVCVANGGSFEGSAVDDATGLMTPVRDSQATFRGWYDGSSSKLDGTAVAGTVYNAAWDIKAKKPAAYEGQFIYNGSEQTYPVAASEYYGVSGNVQTAVGEYIVTVSLNDPADSTWEDGTTDPIEFEFNILRATYDLSGVSLKSVSVEYDGAEHPARLVGDLPEGVSASFKYVDANGMESVDAPVAVGSYKVVAAFGGDGDNYNDIPTKELPGGVVITKAGSAVNPEPADEGDGTQADPLKAVYGQPVTLKVAVAKNSAPATLSLDAASSNGDAASAASGKVRFFLGDTALGETEFKAAADGLSGSAQLTLDSAQLPIGSSVITARFGGTDLLGASESRIYVEISKISTGVSFGRNEMTLHLGKSSNLAVSAANVPEGALVFSSSDAKRVAVDADGNVTALASGATPVTITANFAGDETHEAAQATCTVVVEDHAFTAAYGSDAAGHWHVCDACGAKSEIEQHAFGDWSVTKEPTATEPGLEARACKVCGFETTAPIPATGSGDPGHNGGLSTGDTGTAGSTNGETGNGGSPDSANAADAVQVDDPSASASADDGAARLAVTGDSMAPLAIALIVVIAGCAAVAALAKRPSGRLRR